MCVQWEGCVAAALDGLFSDLISQITSQGISRVFSGLYQSSRRVSIVPLVTAWVELEAVCDPQGISQGSSFIYSVFSLSRFFYHMLWSRSPFQHIIGCPHSPYVGRVGFVSATWRNPASVGGTCFISLPDLWALSPPQRDMPGTRVINPVFPVLWRKQSVHARGHAFKLARDTQPSFSPLTVSVDTITAGWIQDF